eukprot:1610468-Prymnesium_polylepis.1
MVPVAEDAHGAEAALLAALLDLGHGLLGLLRGPARPALPLGRRPRGGEDACGEHERLRRVVTSSGSGYRGGEDERLSASARERQVATSSGWRYVTSIYGSRAARARVAAGGHVAVHNKDPPRSRVAPVGEGECPDHIRVCTRASVVITKVASELQGLEVVGVRPSRLVRDEDEALTAQPSALPRGELRRVGTAVQSVNDVRFVVAASAVVTPGSSFELVPASWHSTFQSTPWCSGLKDGVALVRGHGASPRCALIAESSDQQDAEPARVGCRHTRQQRAHDGVCARAGVARDHVRHIYHDMIAK